MMYIAKPTQVNALYWRCKTDGSRTFSTAPSVMRVEVYSSKWTKVRQNSKTHTGFYLYTQSAL